VVLPVQAISQLKREVEKVWRAEESRVMGLSVLTARKGSDRSGEDASGPVGEKAGAEEMGALRQELERLRVENEKQVRRAPPSDGSLHRCRW
jgi:hypothetical protein